jgi:hypothetical protein
MEGAVTCLRVQGTAANTPANVTLTKAMPIQWETYESM